MRLACVNVPGLPVAVERRDNSALAALPVIVFSPLPVGEGPGVRAYVHDLSLEAREFGVRPGMPLQHAQRLCPEGVVVPARPDVYAQTFHMILHILFDFTPRVEPADAEKSWLAMHGLLARGQDPAQLAGQVMQRVRREAGLTASVGVARGKYVSLVSARCATPGDVLVHRPAEELGFLHQLPVGFLPLGEESLRQLHLLGLLYIRQYARLPARSVLARFGYAGQRAYQLANGHDDYDVTPFREAPRVEAGHTFVEPIADWQRLRCWLGRLVDEVIEPLARDFQSCQSIELSVSFEDGVMLRRERELSQPSVSRSLLLTNVEALFGQIGFRKPIDGLRLAARGLCPTQGHQLELFRHEHERRQQALRRVAHIRHKFGVRVAGTAPAPAARHAGVPLPY
jgi:DNA polymerase-4